MPVQAKHTINTGDYVYKPGDIISDLTVEEEQRLIRLGAAVVVGDDKNNAEDSLAEALGVMTNADIAGYGKSIGLDFASKATKADMISDILASDADVNLELLSDEALRVMASAEQLDVPENATREELIDILGE
nr:MAG TPA: HeH/LEM domain [Caudoviricetes sp.]DAX49042.1 MAG TPA: HeH/LEM domain [Caudoviricetes sp.]